MIDVEFHLKEKSKSKALYIFINWESNFNLYVKFE